MPNARRTSMLAAALVSMGLAGCGQESRDPAASAEAVTLEPGAPGAEVSVPSAYHANILALAAENNAFRRVLFTGARTQLVAMSIPPGGDIGQERHVRVEQILFCASGRGRVIVNGVSSPFEPGDVVVVTPGSTHNFLNEGSEPLRIYTIYAPPNHIQGRVQATKAEAERDTEDEEFGRRVEQATPEVPPAGAE